jgi:RNA polymerase sigma factor (sigma-70 family)
MTPATLPPEALVEHAAWLRRLAAGLVRGDGDAEDLVQETFLAAIRNPPRLPREARDEGSTRGWLGEVLRNARRMRARSAGRRARREAELGALGLEEAASPSPEVLLARFEASRRLATLVTELAEPLRSTLLLRYFEGLSAAEIARRQGVPAGTVRWRLKTGLDRLRHALDRESGGSRAGWSALLLPLAGAPDVARATAWKWKGIAIMSSAMKTGVLVTAAVLLVGVVGWRTRTAPPGKVTDATRAVAPRARDEVPAPASAPSALARLARDQMRDRILETLRRRSAELPGARAAPPAAPAAAHDVGPASPPADDAGPGKYDPAYIRQAVREDIFPLLKSCYAGALLRQPKLGGRLVFKFTIVGDPSVGGVVEDADFAEDSDIKDDEMRTCTRESMMTLTFDKPPSGGGYVTVTYPVLFAPGDDEPADAGAP